MNPTSNSDRRNMIILIAVLVAVFLVLALNLAVWVALMGGGMMNAMTGMNGGAMNDMIAACTNMMQNFHSP